MQQVVINACHGGFGLSDEATELYKLFCTDVDVVPEEYEGFIGRDSKELVSTVKVLGDRANTRFSKLKIVEIPDDVKWQIHDYDGWEWVAEQHRVWD